MKTDSLLPARKLNYQFLQDMRPTTMINYHTPTPS